MNQIFIKQGLNFIKTLNQNMVNLAVFLSFVSSLFFSSQAYANRPAMEERAAATNEAAVNESVVETSNRPAEVEPEAPSSVEIMMQQQPRQTGDVVQLPATEIQPGETLKIKLLDAPRRGMSMDIVRREFGQPINTSESVGQPPITHWTYHDRIVYFEYSTVLHVVAR